MLHNKLLRVIQAHLVGFSTNIVLSCKRFCLFCLFRTSLSFAGCLVQLVYTYFPNRVIYRAHRRFIGPLGGYDDVRIKKVLCIISCYPFKREAASLAADIVYPDPPGVYEFRTLKREAVSLASEPDGRASINMPEIQSL